MRAAAIGSVTCLAAITSLALATPEADSTQTYHLRGYYQLSDQVPTWRSSDKSPWQVEWKATWADPRLVKWGYAPVTHDSHHYYCLIDDRPPTGTNIPRQTFICGDPATAEMLYSFNRRPVLPLYGGGR